MQQPAHTKYSPSTIGISTLGGWKQATGIWFSAFLNKIMFEVALKMKIATTADEMKIGEGLLMDFKIAAPEQYQPTIEFVDQCMALAKESNGKITIMDDIQEAVKGVDFLYTNNWFSSGEDLSTWKEKIKLLKPYQVNQQVVYATGNPKVRFMHCLPANHNRDSEIGQEIYKKFGLDAMEVTDEVFESPASIVFDQAENRVHSLKAIILATLP